VPLQAQKAEEAWGREKKALMERLERLQKANKARRAELDDLTAQVQPCPQQIFSQLVVERKYICSAASVWQTIVGTHCKVWCWSYRVHGVCPGNAPC